MSDTVEKSKRFDLPVEEVEVKVGFCRKCKGTISAAVWHCLDKRERNSWMKEAGNDDLDVKTVPLLEYKENPNWGCKCNKPIKSK